MSGCHPASSILPLRIDNHKKFTDKKKTVIFEISNKKLTIDGADGMFENRKTSITERTFLKYCIVFTNGGRVNEAKEKIIYFVCLNQQKLNKNVKKYSSRKLQSEFYVFY